MASMKQIKTRTKSVKSTQQITKAMNLVSASKLQKTKDRLEHYRIYFDKIEETMASIVKHTKYINHPYLRVRNDKRRLYIVITSDRGLCGGYNSNIIKFLLEDAKDKNPELIVVGKKAKGIFAKREFEVVEELIGISENPQIKDARDIAETALELYRNDEVDEVSVIYTKFNSTIDQEVKKERILPVDVEKIEIECHRDTEVLHTYEPSPEDVLSKIIPQYAEGVILGALIESATSEQGARMTAMDSATENAGVLIDDLTLLYNRKRQAAITQEIAELVSGAEALK
ncbi:MAG: ATP synthase F1 subunit gamma [Clostridia bacterium]|jgi:F-type H+-transporting ATPase subunit gamma|nr:ATP synthase F1 subunit gamma [Clostridia bacterium]